MFGVPGGGSSLDLIVPVMLTYKAKGVLADRDGWFAGVFTNGALEQEIVNEADGLIAIGLDRVELLPRPWTPRQPIVEVDGDIDSGVRVIGSQLGPSGWDPEALQRAIVAQRERLRAPSARLTPDRVIRAAAAGRGSTLIDARVDPAPYGDMIRTIRG